MDVPQSRYLWSRRRRSREFHSSGVALLIPFWCRLHEGWVQLRNLDILLSLLIRFWFNFGGWALLCDHLLGETRLGVLQSWLFGLLADWLIGDGQERWLWLWLWLWFWKLQRVSRELLWGQCCVHLFGMNTNSFPKQFLAYALEVSRWRRRFSQKQTQIGITCRLCLDFLSFCRFSWTRWLWMNSIAVRWVFVILLQFHALHPSTSI